MDTVTPNTNEGHNNPGNVRWAASTHWVGQVGRDTARNLCIFDTTAHGIRALTRVIVSYVTYDKCETVRDIIYRWAPPDKNGAGDHNPTDAYMENVCAWTEYTAYSKAELTSAWLLPFVKAVIRQENGRVIYTDDEISAGIVLALAD